MNAAQLPFVFFPLEVVISPSCGVCFRHHMPVSFHAYPLLLPLFLSLTIPMALKARYLYFILGGFLWPEGLSVLRV
jgi:hypothetical protein